MAKLPFKNLTFLMQKRLAASIPRAPVSASPQSSFTVDYLVTSCGIPLKSAIAASRTVHLKEKDTQRYDSVLDLFKSHGFDQTQVATMMEKGPRILTELKVDENLKPKLEYLAENGISGSHLHELIASDPDILGSSLSSRIKPSMEYLRSLLGTEERLRQAVKRNSRLLSHYLEATLKPKVDFLLKEGVPLEAITKFFLLSPDPVLSSAHRLASALEIVKGQLGVDPAAPKFLLTVRKIACSGVDLWEKKVQVFESFGFSREQALSIFTRCPECFSRSEETLKSKLEFYLGTAKLKLDDIVSYPLLISLAIDTRSRPRHNVLKLLLSEKLLKEDAKFASIFTMSEEKFVKKYVMGHLQEVPSLFEMYHNGKVIKNGISQQTTT